MITLQESILSLRDAAKALPKVRGGSRPHIATIYRWAMRGVRGVRLETISVGGTRCTSSEALERFVQRLNEPDAPASLGTPPSSSTSQRLDAEGL